MRLEKLIPHVWNLSDSIWQFLMTSIDPAEREQQRIKQKMYLARYGRESVFVWEDREVSELDTYFLALVDLISKENDIQRASEER